LGTESQSSVWQFYAGSIVDAETGLIFTIHPKNPKTEF
jgi:hypothetical protein